MANMLSLQDCMVIFTSPDTVDLIKSHRDPLLYPQTIIIPVELNQTFAYNLLTEEEWSHQESIDKETTLDTTSTSTLCGIRNLTLSRLQQTGTTSDLNTLSGWI